ncbi:MAG: glycosyltransferase [Caldisericia bacterium]
MKTPLLIFSSQDWDDLPTRKHRFAKAFAANGNPVLFVEAPFTYLSRFADKSYNLKLKKSGQIEKVRDNLWVASPPPVMPFYGRYRFMQNQACKKLSKFVNKVRTEIGFPTEFISLFYLPWMNPILKSINPKVAVYDCVDDHTGYGGTQCVKFLDRVEGELAKSCNAVFATAKYLTDNLKKHNNKAIYLPNAVDENLFKKTLESDAVRDIKKPRVVYAGALRWWFDSELLFSISKALPEVSFIIIGGERGSELGKNGTNLRSLPNVHFLGRRPQEQLPSLMSGSSCGIIPFKQVELTKSVSPLKLYEYASIGLPTVSVPMSELESFPDSVVTKANTAEEFIEAIKRITSSEPDQKAISEFVSENTWSNRTQRFSQELLSLWEK